MNNPYFGGMPNYQMPVAGNKYGYGQNAMVAPGAYGPDPNTVSGGGGMGYGGGNPGFAFGGMSPQYMSQQTPQYLGPSAPMTPGMQQQYNFARSSEGMRPNQYGGYPQMGMQQHPLMRNRGMRPFRGQNALNSMYGQMPSPYASIE